MNRRLLSFLITVHTGILAAGTGLGYERYLNEEGEDDTNCAQCHGGFKDSTSPKGSVFPFNDKHEMHRNAAAMDADCNLCHKNGDNRNPYIDTSNGTSNNSGLGCTGCHIGIGLRRHHALAGISDCAECHLGEENLPVPPEDVVPPYYGTADSRVAMPCNDVLAANTNENWTIGDFVGLDNNGDNLYDLADFACAPYRIVGIDVEGNDTRVTWETAGGRTDHLRTSTTVDGTYSGVGTPTFIQGIGIIRTNRLHIGGAMGEGPRMYLMRSLVD